MAMMINAKVVGYGPDPETTKALVNIIVEFSGPTESWCPVGYFSPSRTP